MSFIEELKRRNVFRVGAAYAVAGWLLMQIVDVFAPALHLPEWFPTAVAFLLLIGLPIALFFAWAFEITPDGIKRESEIEKSASVTHETAAKLDRVTIALLVLVIAMFAADRFFLKSDSPVTQIEVAEDAAEPSTEPVTESTTATDGRQSVAVLPFVNMSDDEQNEYFSDGISEELLNVLVKIESLRVPSRTSSFTFKNSTMKLSDIGRELGVDHVLEGSVRKAGDRIRVTAQLIEVDSDSHLWSETYTRELNDIFAVQDEISQAIVQALQVTLNGQDEQALSNHGTENVEAYNKYLLGRHIWNRRNIAALREAVYPLKEAVALDPDYEQAWTALADVYVLSPEYGVGPIDYFVPLAREAIARALEINPASARALTVRGYLRAMYEYDVQCALTDFEHALEIEPSYATGRQWYAEILAVNRQLDKALEQLDIAIELDPLAPVMRHVRGWLLSADQSSNEALEAYLEVFTVDPGYRSTYLNLSNLYLLMGNYELARQSNDRGAEVIGFDNAPWHAVVDAVENPEDRSLTERAILAVNESDAFLPGASGNAAIFMALGEHELALDDLEAAFEAGDPYAIHINRLDQHYGAIREHPRFQALLRKMNLADDQRPSAEIDQ